MPTQVKAHITTLEPGDRFRFEPDGPVYRRAVGPDNDRIWIIDDLGKLPVHRLDFGSCFVLAIDPFEDSPHDQHDRSQE